MKKNQNPIVILGHEEHLLATRQWVLQTRGYRVVTANKASALESIPDAPPVKLLVLCDSCSHEERHEAEGIAGVRWPGVKTLTLTADTSRVPSGILGQLLHTMDGSGKLLSMVTELVGSSAELQTARHP